VAQAGEVFPVAGAYVVVAAAGKWPAAVVVVDDLSTGGPKDEGPELHLRAFRSFTGT
jgi:hypothetical protein